MITLSSYHAMNPLSVSFPHLLVVKSQFYWLGGFWMLASSSFETFIALQTNAPLVIYRPSRAKREQAAAISLETEND
jgi:hypothetical protein